MGYQDPLPSRAVTPPVVLKDGARHEGGHEEGGDEEGCHEEGGDEGHEEGDEECELRRRCRGRRFGHEEEAGRGEGCHEEGGHEEGGHEEEGLRGVSLAFEGVWVLGVSAAAAFVVRARGLGLLPPPS